MYNKRRFVLCALLISLVATLASAQVYKITDLGPLSPTDINIWGQVVGNLNGQAFIWTQFGGQKGLGILTGGTFSYATSINDLGVVTGSADGPFTVISPDPNEVPNQYCSDLTQPFVWTQRKGMQGLGVVAPPDSLDYLPEACESFLFYGTGINYFGQVVGYSEVYGSYQWGLLWTSTNGMNVFGGSWPPTFANVISNTGQIVGQNSTIDDWGIGHATSWKSGVATDLGALGGGAVAPGCATANPAVCFASSADGVNDRGQVVGWSTTSPISYIDPLNESAPVHAVLWTRSGTISDLGTLPGDTSSTAWKINFFGLVIGSSGDTPYVDNGFFGPGTPFEVIGRPFIWSQRSGMQDLNTLISANSGWVLQSATGINIWGQIVGSGTLNGQSHGFLLTPKKL
jgi:probable HAF family extracellular repeat protein